MFLRLPLLATAVVLVFTSGCAGATESQLRDRATFDLDCPEDQIELQELDDRTMGVKGCGQRATYVEDCETCEHTNRCNCTWMLNTDGQPRDDH